MNQTQFLDSVKGVTRSLIDYLRRQIISGEMEPGEKINEIKIATGLGISRSPLREALRILENERLIVNIPRKGSVVSEISLEDFIEITQVRQMIELYALDLMKEKKIRDLPQVDSIVWRRSGIPMPSPNDSIETKLEYLASSHEYHTSLVESADNTKLIQFYQTIYSSIERYQFFYAFDSGITSDGKQDHQDILDSIHKGHYVKAKNQLKIHLDYYSGKIKQKLKNLKLQ